MGSDTMPKKTSKSSKTKSSPPKWKIQTPSSTKTKKEHRYRQLRKENEEKLSPFKNSPARPKFVQFDSQNVPNTRAEQHWSQRQSNTLYLVGNQSLEQQSIFVFIFVQG